MTYEQMDSATLTLLSEIEKERVENGIGPENVMVFNYILREFKKSIGRLRNQGKLKIGESANDKYISIL